MRLISKYLFVISFLGLVFFALANGLAHFVVSSVYGVSVFDKEEYASFKQKFLIEQKKKSIPHPFFGLSRSHWKSYPNDLTTEPLFDYISDNSDQQSDDTDQIKILVLGGSVAKDLSNSVRPLPKDLLGENLNTYFDTDRFVVYSAAFGGGKQPQQLFKLVYLDLIGFEPDLVINLDGFNEIALTLAENQSLGIPAIFPRSFSRTVNSVAFRLECVADTNNLVRGDTSMPLAALFELISINNCHNQIDGLQQNSGDWKQWLHHSPDTDYLLQSVSVWWKSSNKIYEFLQARQIPYIHAIQPNQYQEGSKILSVKEADKFLKSKKFGEPIKQHYHKLNVDMLNTPYVTDLRFVFKNEVETMYIDACCHMNEEGMNSMILELIKSNETLFRELL